MSRIGELQREVGLLRNVVRDLKEGGDVAPADVSERAPKSAEINPAALNPKKSSSVEPVAEPRTPAPVPQTVHKSQKTKEKSKTKPKRRWEEEFGARWTVWVGGIALLFGAVFLLRYAAEAGIFTPAMRISLAVLMGSAALGVGEILRRFDPEDRNIPDVARPVMTKAYIPGVLTGVGIFTLLGAIYAAFGIYGLIGPTIAFVLLGLISLGGMATGIIHGPSLSAFGLLAALTTPLLVHTGTPQYAVLYTYLIIVGASAIGLGLYRGWAWLSLAAFSGLLFWLAFTLFASVTHYPAWAVYGALIYMAALALHVRHKDGAAHIRRIPFYIGSSVFALIVWLSVENVGASFPQLFGGVVMALLYMGVSWRVKTLALKLLLGGVLAGGVLRALAGSGMALGSLLMWALPLMGIFLGLGTLLIAAGRLDVRGLKSSVLVPFITFLTFAIWPFVNIHLPDSGMGMLMAGLSIGFVALAYYHSRAGRGWDVRAHLVVAALSYLLAVALYFTGVPVSLGLMAGIVLFALLSMRIKSDLLPYIALGFAGLVAAHVLFLELPTEGRVGSRLIFNQLWMYLALPAVLCAGTAMWFGRGARSLGSEGLKAMALAFAALFAVFQVRHLMNGGDLFARTLKFDELALQVLIGLSFTLGGTLISQKGAREKLVLHDRLVPHLAMGISGISLLVFAVGICLVENPLFEPQSLIRGNVLVNSLTLAFFLPSVLLAGIAFLSQSRRPVMYVRIAAGLSLLAFVLFLTTQVRFIFTGADISLVTSSPRGLELYLISVAWLALGVVLLFAGLKTKRRDLRLASAIVVILTVLKAFLVDMAGLEGVLRALAFVGLGVILIVIGRIYQRLLFSSAETKSA